MFIVVYLHLIYFILKYFSFICEILLQFVIKILYNLFCEVNYFFIDFKKAMANKMDNNARAAISIFVVEREMTVQWSDRIE